MNGKACSSDDFECMKGCLLLYGTESNWMIPFQDSNSELLCFINTEQGEVLLTLYSKIFSQNSILNLFPYQASTTSLDTGVERGFSNTGVSVQFPLTTTLISFFCYRDYFECLPVHMTYAFPLQEGSDVHFLHIFSMISNLYKALHFFLQQF